MPAAFVQSNNQIDTAGGGTQVLNLAYPNPNTLGDLLFVSCGWYNNNNSPTISDTLGNTWVALPQQSNVYNMQAWYCLNCKAGSNTVSLTWGAPAAQYSAMCIDEWAGGVFTLDAHNESSVTSGSISLTTTMNGDAVFSYAMGTYDNYSADTGWTLRSWAGSAPMGLEDTLQSSAGVITSSFGGSRNARGIAAFSSVSAARPPSRMLMGVGQ